MLCGECVLCGRALCSVVGSLPSGASSVDPARHARSYHADETTDRSCLPSASNCCTSVRTKIVSKGMFSVKLLTLLHPLFVNSSSSSNNTKRLSTILMNVLLRRFPSLEQLGLLENFLNEEQITIKQVLMAVVPSCESIVLNCRWQYDIVSCEKLFNKEFTEWGVCCVMRPQK